MDNEIGLCKHGKISRNCYTCLTLHNPQEKTELDTLHEKLSELQIRVAKLEEYKRLQDDKNKSFQYFLDLNHEIYAKLDQHRQKQIDENRAVSKRLDEISGSILNSDVRICELEDWKTDHESEGETYGEDFEKRDAKLESRLKDLEESYQGLSAELRFVLEKVNDKTLQERLSQLEDWTRKDEERIYGKLDACKGWLIELEQKLAEIKDQLNTQKDISVVLLDKFKQIIKTEIAQIHQESKINPLVNPDVRFVGNVTVPKETLCLEKFTVPSKIISFNEAFFAFIAGKMIKRKNGHSYLLASCEAVTFSPNDILATDWEICE